VPLLPFLLGAGAAAVPFAAGLSLIALFGVGAVMSLFSGRNALLGGVRMATIGALAGAATFGIGSLFGASAN
jgi:VIT1/CCC1 family predicted Fe2+/Mn2+ transporter